MDNRQWQWPQSTCRWPQAFLAFDENNDGQISTAEFRRGIRALVRSHKETARGGRVYRVASMSLVRWVGVAHWWRSGPQRSSRQSPHTQATPCGTYPRRPAVHITPWQNHIAQPYGRTLWQDPLHERFRLSTGDAADRLGGRCDDQALRPGGLRAGPCGGGRGIHSHCSSWEGGASTRIRLAKHAQARKQARKHAAESAFTSAHTRPLIRAVSRQPRSTQPCHTRSASSKPPRSGGRPSESACTRPCAQISYKEFAVVFDYSGLM